MPLSQAKLTATIIWFAIFVGLFFILQFLGGGVSALTGEFQVRSFPLMLVGVAPLVVGVVGRMLLLPKAKTDEIFQVIFLVCLGLCEAPAFTGFLVFPEEMASERAMAFIGSVLGTAFLCPLGIRHPSDQAGS